MKKITLLLLLIAFTATAQYKVDNIKAPLNPVPLKYITEHFGFYGDVKKVLETGVFETKRHFNSNKQLIYEEDLTGYLYGDSEYTYNEKGQLDTSANTKRGSSSYTYNDLGFISNIITSYYGNITEQTFTYNEKKLLVKSTIENYSYKELSYDSQDRIIESIEYLKNEFHSKTVYKYQQINDVLKVTSTSTFANKESKPLVLSYYFGKKGKPYSKLNSYDKYGNIVNIPLNKATKTYYFYNNEVSSPENAMKLSQNEVDNFSVNKFENGDVYEGATKNGQLNGYGIYAYVNGGRIEGTFKDGKMHGICKVNDANGDYVKGNYIEEKKEGEFEIYRAKENKKYKEVFKNDKRIDSNNLDNVIDDVLNEMNDFKCISGNCKNGYGKFSNNDGVYEGDILNYQPHGKGTFKYKAGYSFTGDFVKGSPNGKGLMEYDNGNIYKGEYKDWKITGYGEYTWTNGDTYKGLFKNNTFHGKGIFYSKSEDVIYDALFENGEMKEVYSKTNASVKPMSNSINDIMSFCNNNSDPVKCYKEQFTNKKEAYNKAGKSQSDIISFLAHDIETLGNHSINYAFKVCMDNSIVGYDILKNVMDKLPLSQKQDIAKLAQKMLEDARKD